MLWKSVLLLVAVFQIASALHFYTFPGETRCFYEELPKGTVVVGKFDAYVNTKGDEYDNNPNLKLAITVDVSILWLVLSSQNPHTNNVFRKHSIMIIELSHKRVQPVVTSHSQP